MQNTHTRIYITIPTTTTNTTTVEDRNALREPIRKICISKLLETIKVSHK